MGLVYRKRVPLIPGRLWLNLHAGWPSLSLRVGRLTFNSRTGFSSARLGHGVSWRDRDRDRD